MKGQITLMVVLLALITACQTKEIQTPKVQRTIVAPAPVVPTIAPNIDNSSTVPDCVTAGERIAQYVEVGMSQQNVRRLVGKPVKSQGSRWGWARGAISYPGVQFRSGVVSTYGADTSACK